MLSASLIQQLKRVNISKDAEKTKQRFEELWKAASASDKSMIEEQAGVARNTLYRIYNTGSITPKIVVSTSQVLNVNPYYLTGEADETGETSDDVLREFLNGLGYQELLAKADKEQKVRKPRKKREPKALSPSISETTMYNRTAEEVLDVNQSPESYGEVENPEPEVSCEIAASKPFFDEFSEDDIILLLRSVKIRAKAGVADAAKQAEDLKKILLS